MDNRDISINFSDEEKTYISYLETVKEKLYDNREIKLTYQ